MTTPRVLTDSGLEDGARRVAHDAVAQLEVRGREAHLGVRRMNLPDAAEALRVTGYERGTITPFGAAEPWPVIADASIDPDGQVSIGGGAHGVSVKMRAHDLVAAVSADVADVTKPLG